MDEEHLVFRFTNQVVFRTDVEEPVIGWNGRLLHGALMLKTDQIKEAAELWESEMKRSGNGT